MFAKHAMPIEQISTKISPKRSRSSDLLRFRFEVLPRYRLLRPLEAQMCAESHDPLRGVGSRDRPTYPMSSVTSPESGYR